MAIHTMSGQSGSDNEASHSRHAGDKRGHYARFAAMVGLSFVAMYVFMYSMVDTLPNVYNNVNQIYMAGVMAAPMAVIEILIMRKMYADSRRNALIIAASLVAFVLFWTGIRKQIGVGDAQFIRSMIPHHSGAILMCREAKIEDAELRELCASIVRGQQDEIDRMKRILDRLR